MSNVEEAYFPMLSKSRANIGKEFYLSRSEEKEVTSIGPRTFVNGEEVPESAKSARLSK